jgi:hypothetical protein
MSVVVNPDPGDDEFDFEVLNAIFSDLPSFAHFESVDSIIADFADANDRKSSD